MKKTILLLNLFLTTLVYSQNYNPVVNYQKGGTPTYGIKIKTNLPFISVIDGNTIMPTIIIEGYEYPSNSIGIILNWYVINGTFYAAVASSFGNYTPEIKLYKENNKVVIFINDKTYYDSFTVRAYAGNPSSSQDLRYSNWEIVDELPTGTISKTFDYKNKFEGKIEFPKGVWDKDGNVGIGTTETKGFKLGVKGKIAAEEVKVALYNDWADFVFEKEYKLPTLQEVEKHIKEKGHLKDIPSAKEVNENGIFLGEMNVKLLQKIEELTLYTIQQQKELNKEKERNNSLEKRLKSLEKVILNKGD